MMSKWKVLSNHGAVLAYVSKHPHVRGADIAAAIGVRERTVFRIMADLLAEGYLEKELVGRYNRYQVNFEAPLKRSIMGSARVGDLLEKLIPLVEVKE